MLPPEQQAITRPRRLLPGFKIMAAIDPNATPIENVIARFTGINHLKFQVSVPKKINKNLYLNYLCRRRNLPRNQILQSNRLCKASE
jgi:hypothetical protein